MKLKVKGRFLADVIDLRHTPNARIVPLSIQERIRTETPLEDTIYGCTDINQFILTQAVKGQWTTRWNDRPLGKMLRFYKSNRADAAPIIKSPGEGDKGNAGVVSNSEGCIPLEDLPDVFPTDLNYQWYIAEAQSLWDAISAPKTAGMNRWAEVIHNAGLRPCYVDPEGKRSRARVEYGTTDFSSKPPGHVFGTGTGDGLLAKVGITMDVPEIGRVSRTYPGKTRKKILDDDGFELIFGARVPLTGRPFYETRPVMNEEEVDTWYTPAELRKVGR